MKVLLTGANGYIGTQLIPLLLQKGHEVICLVRDIPYFKKQFDLAADVTLLKGDLLRERSIEPLPQDIDAAYYLMHSMTQTSGFAGLEALAAQNFVKALNKTACKQIVFVNQLTHPSTDPLISRQHIQDILLEANAGLTVIKTAMILGPGSIAVEMLKGLTEKENVVLAQKWADAKIQPVAIADLVFYLEAVLHNPKTLNHSFEIGGPDDITFRDLLLSYAKLHDKKINISVMPFILSRLSAYWLNFLTPINYSLAENLIESLKHDTVCEDSSIHTLIDHDCVSYTEALKPLTEINSI